jgi:hypothetical protein
MVMVVNMAIRKDHHRMHLHMVTELNIITMTYVTMQV